MTDLKAGGIEIRPVTVDDWTGRSGAAAFVEDRQVSPVLADPGKVTAWLDANRALVEGALARGWDVPSHATLDRYGRSLAQALGECRRKLRRAEGDAGRYVESLARREAEDEEDLADLRWLLGETRTEAAALTARVASIQDLQRRLAEDPVPLFLPVGALVRMKVTARPESWVGGRESPPVPGSLGVVVGPTDAGVEWSTKVAFLRFTDGNGDTWSRSLERPLSMGLDAADLEVVELGRYADGTPCRSIDFRATHRRADGVDEEARDMVVESNGAAWTVTLFGEGEGAWVEMQGWASLDELDHLTPVGETPTGPTP